MTIFTYPNSRPQSQVFSLVNNTAIFRDPFKGTISTSDRDGEHWRVSCAYENLAGARRREIEAFLLKLNGSQHQFRMRDWSYNRAGVGGGTAQIAGAGQTGKNINIDLAPVSTNGWLVAGDKVQIGDFLYSIDEDIDTTGGGLATLVVTPRVFIAPNDNDSVDIDFPTNLFVLDQESLDISAESNVTSVSFQAVSAL